MRNLSSLRRLRYKTRSKEFGSTFHTFTTETDTEEDATMQKSSRAEMVPRDREDGSQSFFHCFTFYEQIHYNQVVQDFDTKGVQILLIFR